MAVQCVNKWIGIIEICTHGCCQDIGPNYNRYTSNQCCSVPRKGMTGICIVIPTLVLVAVIIGIVLVYRRRYRQQPELNGHNHAVEPSEKTKQNVAVQTSVFDKV
ncbi:hypothetical protein DPMN_090799 [Dreissena polymorpha]|uniref:Uncharacterized protein n=1 Tax=Dreissena polymorpha TaxID=45954 RepID=A0A9D4KYR9_DREPO|nr:hypothetical protein DPMN_090799 [Dreissena polymorpha]